MYNELVWGERTALVEALVWGLTFGLVIGVSVATGVVVGKSAYLRHRVSLAVGWQAGLLPFRLLPFLEDVRESGLMYRAGPGFRFRHRTLTQWLADDWEMRPEAPSWARNQAADQPLTPVPRRETVQPPE